jgi:hypothetical protein
MDGDLRAVDRVLAIMRRRSQLLGLDAPKASTNQLLNFSSEQIDAEIERLRMSITENPN